MTYSTLTNTINDAFDVRDSITQDTIGEVRDAVEEALRLLDSCLLYTSPSPRDSFRSRMPSSA